MQITDKVLVQMLIANAYDDSQNGYNRAIIELLKKSMLETKDSDAFPKLRKALGAININPYEKEAIMNNMTAERIDSLLMNKQNGSKLQGVKDFKEWTGLGLKDAKDVVDAYWESLDL